MSTTIDTPVGNRPSSRSKVSALRAQPSSASVPPLIDGDRLDSTEFLRRYEAMPELTKAELIQGTVYIMSSPVRYQKHAKPDGTMHGLLWNYSVATPGVEFGPNATVRLDPENTFQPDGLMRLSPQRGGRSTVDSSDYVVGVPELLVEISASSASVDTRSKKDACREKGVPEYICWLTEIAEFKWWHFKDGDYQLIPVDADGISRSRVFPGFWLDVNALLTGDDARVMKVLQMGLESAAHTAFLKD